MNKENIFGIFLVVIVIIAGILPWVNAENIADNLAFQQGKEVDLKIPCVYEEAVYCDSLATCNMTINLPDGTNLINNQPMTYNEAYFNYTLNSNQTDIIGTYAVTMVCEDNGAVGFSSFSFDITTTGASGELKINILFFIFLVIAIIFLIFGLIIGNFVFTFFSGSMFIVSGVSLFVNNMIYLPTLLNNVFCYVLWGVGAYLIIMSGLKALEVE